MSRTLSEKAGLALAVEEHNLTFSVEKGLPPLPEAREGSVERKGDSQAPEKAKEDTKPSSSKPKGLSFSSGKPLTKSSNKRKAISQPDSDPENDLAVEMGIDKLRPKEKGKSKEKFKKKSKKESKKLLSFADDA